MTFARSAAILFVLGAILRLVLFSANPPVNSFDNHYEPVRLIMETGRIPAKNACFQCYHPPVFYGISAYAGKTAVRLGLNPVQLPKLLQFFPCLYGLLHLGLVALILMKLTLSDFSRTIAFAAACFLPQHIYISAMHSNDTISYLAVALCLYLLLEALDRKLSLPRLIGLSAAMTAALFTKYTAFAVIPAVAAPFLVMLLRPHAVPVKKVLISMAVVFIIPLACLGWYMKANLRDYKTALPWNTGMMDPGTTQPRAAAASFHDFRPLTLMQKTVIAPELVGSFWTLVYGRMWFDIEPKFLYFTDPDDAWWERYYGWIRGEGPFPAPLKRFSGLTRFSCVGLLAAGLVPLLLVLSGCLRMLSWQRDIKMVIFPVLLAANLAGVIAMVLKMPVFSMMKAVYLLGALPALCVFMAAGMMNFEKHRFASRLAAGFIIFLCALVSLHIAHIAVSARPC